MEIVEVDSTRGIKPALITLLQDCVASGASVGFLPPLQEEQGLAYWHGIEADLVNGVRKLWVAFDQHLPRLADHMTAGPPAVTA